MTVRNLEYLMRPSTVALIGASERPSSVGELLTRNLLCAGFAGRIYLVNPNYRSIGGLACYPNVESLPEAPDLAVIATPPETVPELVAELALKGAKSAVIITAGFGEGGDDRGKKLCAEMLGAARPHLLRIVGPNCLGIIAPRVGLNASIAHIGRPIPGSIAFVAQSGAVQTSVLDWAISRGIGFSHVISLGDMIDVDFGDLLDYLASDFHARAILLYMETITSSRKFMSAARAAARVKPVIVLKAGRFEEGAMAAARHTGANTGNDAVCDAAFRRAGMLRVYHMQSLFDTVETLAMMPHPITGDRLAILTNGGGVGVLATDALIQRGGRLAELSQQTMEGLDVVLPSTWSRGNPVDIVSDAPAERYAEAMKVVLDDKGIDAVLVLNCPVGFISGTDAASAVIETYEERSKKPGAPILLTSWLGENAAAKARELFSQHRLPTYTTPSNAVRAFMHMVNYQRNQKMLMETPPSIPESFSPDVDGVRRTIEKALADAHSWLSETDTRSILSAYGIPTLPFLRATTLEAAAALSARLGGAPTLQVISTEESTVEDFCTTSVHLETHVAVKKLTEIVADYCSGVDPGARVHGIMVQPVLRRSHAHELMIEVANDAQFGPVITFGHGGNFADEIQDKTLAFPPLNMHLAHEAISRTRIYQLLKGRRGMPPAHMEEIVLTLVKISQLICDCAEIQELSINPLLADASGVVALNARIRIAPSEIPASERLAIRPYPKELEESITLPDGSVMQIRPIRPEDEPGFLKIFESLSPEERRMRFLHPMKELSHNQAARLTQIDYDRDMALVLAATGRSESGEQDLYGSVRIIVDPDKERAEYAILVHKEMAGKGLGKLLMRRIIDYARSRGIKKIYGQVLRENIPMLKVCNALGFTSKHDPDDLEVIIVSLLL